jgi:hypothetical protein
MRINIIALLFVLMISNSFSMSAQERPTPVELIIGNSRFGLQVIINKYLPNSKKFSFFSVTNFVSTYDNDLSKLDFISNSQVSFEIYKGFGVTTGLSVNKVVGLIPTVGLQYIYGSPQLLIVLTPSYYISKNNNISALGLIEYKPKITKKLHLYSRLQGMYNQNMTSNFHERSYLQLRLGLSISNYQFGLASNFDYYGKVMNFEDNYGVFLKVNL